MTPPEERLAYLEADHEDRLAALEAATAVIASPLVVQDINDHAGWLSLADRAYRWLQQRDSLHAVRIELIAGTPRKEGSPVTTNFNLEDDDQVIFSLTGLDSKGASVPAPSDTWAWSLGDPDSSGASLAVSDDTLTATVSGGVPDTNLVLTVAGQSTGITGAEAIIVTAGPVTTVGLVAGTPSPEAPPAPSA